jgi:hypothetical protein
MEPSEFFNKAKGYGVEIEIRGDILTLSKRFAVGDSNGFVGAETDCGLIYEAPQTRAGSTWGTDGGSVGGLSALQNGRMVLNRSGVSKRWLSKLAKLM